MRELKPNTNGEHPPQLDHQLDERELKLAFAEKDRQLVRLSAELDTLSQRMKDELDKKRAIVNCAAEGVITFDSNGTIETFNPAAERIFGWNASEILGQSIRLIVPTTGTGDSLFDAPTLTSSQPGGKQCDASGQKQDGTEFALELTIGKLIIGSRQIYTGLFTDRSHRKQMEARLALSQKMESVGQLAAGIAHEINTPIQYIGDNARFLSDAFGDLNEYIVEIEELVANASNSDGPENLLKAIRQAADDADLEYIRKEVPQAITQSIEGARRVATIVRAMKEFSHPGSDEKSPVDLNRAIQNTITIARNEWKYVAEVETELDPTLPQVACFASDFNQAILNLIVNAAHAIERKDGGDAGPNGRIHVSTHNCKDFVEVWIKDSGEGIPESIRQKIYDPFFTTKEVGKGTGQGLAITYSVIVEKHGGEIEFTSELGEGTTFVVRLPVNEQG
jgi:two-component system NtrC family sensor kinase